MGNLFEELLGIDLPEIEVKKNKKDAKKASGSKSSKPTEKNGEKLAFPITVLTGIRKPIVLTKEQVGDVDTLEKIADLICNQNGTPRHLTIVKRLSDSKIAVVLDRGKVKAKGDITLTEVSIAVVEDEEISLHEICGNRTAKEINEFLKKTTGRDVPYQFICDKTKLYAVAGENIATGALPLPIRINSPLGEIILHGQDFEDADVEEIGGMSHVFAAAVESKVFGLAEYAEIKDVLTLYRSAQQADETILFVGLKTMTRDILATKEPKETTYPTDAVISMIFHRIPLTPEMFGGKKRVSDKEIIAFLAKDYPEFTEARTKLTYEKDGNYIFPSLKSSSKGSDAFCSREECLAAAKQSPVYFLGKYMENGAEVRYEKTPVSVVEASADGTVGRFQWKLPKIPKQILNVIRELFARISENYEVEALVQITFDPYVAEYSVRIPDQIVSKAAVTTDDMALWTSEMYYVMDIHSHNTMPAFFSPIDDRDEVANRVYGVMGSFGKEELQMKFRAATGGKFVTISPSDIFEEEEDGEEYVVARELYDEWRCNATIE